ncbi:hypothetical protein N7447_006511 [Penicillium robsamsonii]|uniref:uncharacterized protein n=1 Tax=Penicillium robsamsonii TaxID=1792511 RepID=UPI0025473BEA|nr:uncharacterized protein N7447_006511 [Penicillium robsamsonii]KAJ5824171.1 hypothetical protein N7447_006511 [Penicillium robsamsonii]
MVFQFGTKGPGWLTLTGAEIKYLLLANFCYGSQDVDEYYLAQLAGVKPDSALGGFRSAKKKLVMLCSTDMHLLSTLSKQKCDSPTEDTSDEQIKKRPKHKKSKLLPDASDEGSTAESSESEIDESPSKGPHRKTMHKDHAKRKGKGKNPTLDTESEDSLNSEVEEDDSSSESFKVPSKTQRRNTKQKSTKHSRHTKYSTNHGVTNGRYSPFHAGNKSSSSYADRLTSQRKRGLKRDRNPYEFEDEFTEESADESSGAEIAASSSRASHGRVKRKRLEKPSGLSDTSDNESDIDEGVGRRATQAFTKATSFKSRAQTGNHKKVDETNDLAVSPVKDLARRAMDGLTLGANVSKINAKSRNGSRKKLDKTNDLAGSPGKTLVGEAMDSLTLGGDASKTDGRTSTKHGSGDAMYEENEEPEEPESDHVSY